MALSEVRETRWNHSSRLRRLLQPPHRHRRRRPRFHAQLLEQVFQVLVDRAVADAEDVADVPVGLAVDHPVEHFGGRIGCKRVGIMDSAK